MSNESDAGEVLARLGRGGDTSTEPTGQLRVAVREYQGHRLVDVRLWFKSDDGSWRPTKKGTSIRRSELAKVRQALAEAERLPAGQPVAGSSPPKSRSRVRGVPPPRHTPPAFSTPTGREPERRQCPLQQPPQPQRSLGDALQDDFSDVPFG